MKVNIKLIFEARARMNIQIHFNKGMRGINLRISEKCVVKSAPNKEKKSSN